MGERARSMLLASAPFLPYSPIPESIRTYQSEAAFTLGPFRITPWLTDHSALDAYSLLAEAEGKRVFYSGDLRVHGRKARLVERLLAHPPEAIDCLLLEGTTLSRHHDLDRRSETEDQLEERMVQCIKDTEGLVLTAFSPQNIDRFVTIFRSVRRAGRTFIADLYLAHVIDQLKIPSLPSPEAGGFRVYLPAAQRRRIVNSRAFDLVRPYRTSQIFKEEIAAKPGWWAMLFRESMCSDIERMSVLSGATLLYSLWPGYLDQPHNRLRAWCAANRVPLHIYHTSGHAAPTDLVRIAAALKPRVVIPIHTEAACTMQSLIPGTALLPDGEWLSI
jgi:ribonuclease J